MSAVEDSVRRIETLIAALEDGGDAEARRIARSLLEVVLDLHGLALARVAVIVAEAPGGTRLLAQLAEDPHVRAVLLLHGLHPEDTAERVGGAVAALNQASDGEGVHVRVLAVSASSARLSVQYGGATPDALRARVEAAVVDAAPELERVVIEGLDPVTEEALPVLAS